MKAHIHTLGCKVNQYESDQLVGQLIAQGMQITTDPTEADIIYINTCAVTAQAEQKSRQIFRRLARANPSAQIHVVGCASQRDTKPFATATAVRGTVNMAGLLHTQSPPHHSRGRAQVKICDGCDNFCSYCIVPYLRGRVASRSIDSICAELASLSTAEAVLTGINISAFGKDNGSSLCQLLSAIKFDGRIRLGSLECNIIDRQLLDIMSAGNYCDHFHLSLQSGSTKVLADMNRKYTADQFAEKVSLIRNYFPNAGITADIIVGYPTETEADFLQSCQLAREVGFSDIHVFPFSSRQGTVAAKLAPLDPQIVQDRKARLLSIKAQLVDSFLDGQVGMTHQVFFEKEGAGYTSNYCYVEAPAPAGRLSAVLITQKSKKNLKGELVK